MTLHFTTTDNVTDDATLVPDDPLGVTTAAVGAATHTLLHRRYRPAGRGKAENPDSLQLICRFPASTPAQLGPGCG
jgi:hypothetical protein